MNSKPRLLESGGRSRGVRGVCGEQRGGGRR